MRTSGTKYDSIDQLPQGALPVSKYARKHTKWSPAYLHVKYDRFKFGYKKKDGSLVYGEDPGYTIVCYEGTNYVIKGNIDNYQLNSFKIE
jgi:hypothetical protein